MVVFVNYEMEEETRRSKRGGIFRRMFTSQSWSESRRQSSLFLGQNCLARERRPLRSVPTIGSNYKVDPDVLANHYVEKEMKYLGTISDVRHDFDPNNRTQILSLLDEKRKIGQLPWELSWKHDVIVSFSAHNIKLLWRDGEKLIHRIPTHQISAAGLVKDDNRVFQFFKFASELNSEMCNLVILTCETKEFATEICSLTQQLFQLVYTDSTMDFFDKSIQDGAITPKNNSYSTDSSSEKKDTVQMALPLFNLQHQSEPDTNTGQATGRSSTLPRPSTFSSIHNPDVVVSPTSSSTPSSPVNDTGGGIGSSQQIQLKEYIGVLKERLTPDELKLFAEYLHHFRHDGLSIQAFCQHLMELYTEERKSLFVGMQHFIPTEDLSYFKTFLHQNNISCHLEIEEDNGWWSKSDSRTVSENEDRTTEISSNSDPPPLTPTTSEDDWSSVVPKVGFVTIDGDDGNTTLTKTNTKGLMESGDTQCEQESSFIFPSSKIKLPTFKNKRKGKPPSPLEFGAPYPDPAVGTDDDIHADDKDSIEKSLSEPESICASPRPPEHRKNKKHKHFRRGTKM